ncbi:hypothetical protein ACEPPN_009708 [Leptodophora sp. 'Broadleaf-Isolate-01']
MTGVADRWKILKERFREGCHLKMSSTIELCRYAPYFWQGTRADDSIACSLNDFMDYLAYVEFNAENLQFYLWYRDYVRRFEALPETEKALSPEFVPEADEIPDLNKAVEKGERRKTKREASTGLMGTGYVRKDSVLSTSASQSLPHGQGQVTINNEDELTGSPPVTSGSTAVPSDAEVVAQAGLKWQPCAYSALLSVELLADKIGYYSTHARRDNQSDETLSCIYCSSRTQYLPQRPGTLSSRSTTHDPPFRSRASGQDC